jgi:alkylation response protein AidB-like acyl-CoA dehydrogenase
MDFDLTHKQVAIRAMAANFAAAEPAPHAVAWDHAMHIPVDTLRQTGALGFSGIYVRDDVGGTGLTRLDAALIFEALAGGCPTVASYISIHNMSAWMIDCYGSDDQRHAWLPSLTVMEHLASYCLTEPGDDYVLDGAKQFVSGAGTSDIYVVMVRTGEARPRGILAPVVDKGTSGLSFGANERKMGWKALQLHGGYGLSPSTASRRSCATCGSTRSSKAPTKSCGCSSPARCWPI